MSKRSPLSAFTQRKDAPTPAAEPTADTSAPPPSAVSRKIDDPRQRVVLRLHIDAIEALEDIARERRRSAGGKAVPIQSLLEEAVGDFFAKNGLAVEVRPAPAKQRG